MELETIEFYRDGGSLSYIAAAGGKKYFMRAIRPEFLDTALHSTLIHVYLEQNGIPVPPIIATKELCPYVRTEEPDGSHLYIMYEYIEGSEADPQADAAELGALVGRFHSVMEGYTGQLAVRDKHFFVDRYIHILREKRYQKANEFDAYGHELWSRVERLPRGYCHGDLYRGNIHKSKTGTMFILDFDTSCSAFPMYDVALLCNETNYFRFDADGYDKSQEVLERFLRGYLPRRALGEDEIASFFDLLALYHFQLQATIIEIYGLDCVDDRFLDHQLDWLLRWRELCERKKSVNGR
jgi:Ser/Thr protein kinase RdoA (MazF antagonist)